MSEEKFLIYKTEDDRIEIDVRMEDETVWLTIERLSWLFGKSCSTINEHIIKIFKEGS